jgi:hypothetical protein
MAFWAHQKAPRKKGGQCPLHVKAWWQCVTHVFFSPYSPFLRCKCWWVWQGVLLIIYRDWSLQISLDRGVSACALATRPGVKSLVPHRLKLTRLLHIASYLGGLLSGVVRLAGVVRLVRPRVNVHVRCIRQRLYGLGLLGWIIYSLHFIKT